MTDRLLSALSLARKAGKLETGFEKVKDSVIKGRAFLVIIARDIGENTESKIKNLLREIPFKKKISLAQAELTAYELSAVAGKLAGVMCVTDKNLAALCGGALNIT